MATIFWSADFGALVFGREIRRENAKTSLEFWVKTEKKPSEKFFGERDFWLPAAEKIVQTTRFGRVGIFFDRENVAAKKWAHSLSSDQNLAAKYAPASKRRAEKECVFSLFPTQILTQMANENFADSVEFRRLARKFLRGAKNARVDSVLFCDSVLGGERARKILKKIAGTQIQCVFPSDFCTEVLGEVSQTLAQKTQIFSGDEKEFTQKIAQEFLRQKVSDKNICSI